MQDVLATVYHQLGINTHKTFFNEAHRPVEILNYGQPIQEIPVSNRLAIALVMFVLQAAAVSLGEEPKPKAKAP